jgi:hypothetical protein
VPWNPLGALIGPLSLLALVFGRKKKSSKAYPFLLMLVILVVLPLGVGMACEEEHTSTPAEEPEQPYEVETPGGPETVPYTSTPPGTPTPMLEIPECPTAPTTPVLDPSNLPAPNDVIGDPIPYLKAMEGKYNIELPSSFKWGYWFGPLPAPYEKDIYGAATPPYLEGGSALEPNTAYLDSYAFADLNEIEFASVMAHEARHAWLIHFIFHPGHPKANQVLEVVPNTGDLHPIHGPHWGLIAEADAYYVQYEFLKQYNIVESKYLGNSLDKSNYWLNLLESIEGKEYFVPLPFCEPIWC